LKSIHRFNWIVLLLVLSLLFFSCIQDDSTNDDSLNFNQLISFGKFYLGQGDGYTAEEYFQKALEIDSDSIQAKTGIILSTPMELINFVDIIVGTIDALSFTGLGSETKSSTYQAPKSDRNQIHLYLHDMIVNELVRGENAYRDLLDQEEISFYADDYKIYLIEDELLAFGGEFDKADIHLYGAINSLANGIIKILLAHNLYFDYNLLIFPQAPSDATTLETIDPIVQLIGNLLNSKLYPDFLKLVKGTGAANMQLAAIDIGVGFLRIGDALTALGKETDDQKDDQLRFEDINKNGRYNPTVDSVLIGSDIVLEADIVMAVWDLCEKLAFVFFEGSIEDKTPDQIEYLALSDFTEILIVLDVLPLEVGSLTISNLPAYPRFNVGEFFANPTEDGLRSFLITVVNIWNFLFSN